MDGYQADVPELADSLAALYELFLDRYTRSADNPETVPISAFFRLFPLNPTSPIVRNRLFDRGVISISAPDGTASNTGRAMIAIFQDTTFGTIQVQFAATINASMTRTTNSLEFTFAGPVPCEVERVPDILGYSSHLFATKIVFLPKAVKYVLKERDSSGADFFILVNGDPSPPQPRESSKNVDILPLADVLMAADCPLGSDENSCWWVYKSRFDANAGRKRCFLKKSNKNDDGTCEDPGSDGYGGEMQIDGPFQSQSEASQAMNSNSECHD